jgi:flagellar assembly protein FliH
VQAAYDELIAAAQEEVTMLLEDARREASALVAEAERAAVSLRASAQEDGFQKGLTAARDEVAGLLARAQADADDLIGRAEAARAASLEQMEPRILTLALEVAKKVLGYELDHNESAFLSMLRTALAGVKAETHVTLRVNPSEYVRFFKAREVTMHTPTGSLTASVVNDPTVGYGGCLIETEGGAIDAGAAAQVAQIGRNFGIESDDDG